MNQPDEIEKGMGIAPKGKLPEGELLDWSNVEANARPERLEAGPKYDPRPGEDDARRRIAYLLISLLWVLILAILGLLACGVVKIAEVKEFSVLAGPIVTLVSAATGFYYGTKSQ